MAIERQVTVRVDLRASGNVGQQLDQAKAKAEGLVHSLGRMSAIRSPAGGFTTNMIAGMGAAGQLQALLTKAQSPAARMAVGMAAAAEPRDRAADMRAAMANATAAAASRALGLVTGDLGRRGPDPLARGLAKEAADAAKAMRSLPPILRSQQAPSGTSGPHGPPVMTSLLERNFTKADKGASGLKETWDGITRIGTAAAVAQAGILGLVAAASPDAFGTFTKSLQILSGEIGLAFIPGVVKVSGLLQDAARWFRGLDRETKQNIATWATWGVGITVAGFALVKIGGMLATVVSGLAKVGLALTSLGVGPLLAITGLVAAVGYLTNGFGLLGNSASKAADEIKRTADARQTLERLQRGEAATGEDFRRVLSEQQQSALIDHIINVPVPGQGVFVPERIEAMRRERLTSAETRIVAEAEAAGRQAPTGDALRRAAEQRVRMEYVDREIASAEARRAQLERSRPDVQGIRIQAAIESAQRPSGAFGSMVGVRAAGILEALGQSNIHPSVLSGLASHERRATMTAEQQARWEALTPTQRRLGQAMDRGLLGGNFSGDEGARQLREVVDFISGANDLIQTRAREDLMRYYRRTGLPDNMMQGRGPAVHVNYNPQMMQAEGMYERLLVESQKSELERQQLEIQREGLRSLQTIATNTTPPGPPPPPANQNPP